MLLSVSFYENRAYAESKTKIDPAVATLFHLVAQRLSYMEDVARYKWHSQRPIEDPGRERLVLQSAVDSAKNFNLQPDSSRNFFAAQIRAAKEIQQGWISHWHKGSTPAVGPDLQQLIRPQLIDLGSQILRQIELTQVALANADRKFIRNKFLQIVNLRYLGEETVLQLFDALLQINLSGDASDNHLSKFAVASTRLQHILQSGELRVGTTGDYAPFSVLDRKTKNYSGIDIDLARDLAISLGVKLTLVATTWPTLAEDFASVEFDLAMSGVSINLQRQKIGFFSSPYHTGGKTPIALCERVKDLDSLEKINSPGTRVIVNPGGTNFRYAKAHLNNAKLRIFDDNQTIFQEIVEGRADVMVTDAIEVTLQANRSSELCAAMPGSTLTKSEKGYWVQPDLPLLQYVNAWLHQRQLVGDVDKIFSRHLN